MTSELRIDNLSSGYGDYDVLHDVSLVAKPGAVTTIVGGNGAGKTTLLKTIAGLVQVKGGSIWFDGSDISKMPPTRVVRRGVSLVPEGRQLFPRMSVRDNLRTGAFTRWRSIDEKRELERIYDLFPVLSRRAGFEARDLSGGEQQMIAVGRALMANPQCLLLDEPSIGLAPKIEVELMEMIRRLATERGVAVVLVEQNARLALKNSDFGYVIELGRIVMSGVAAALANDRRVKEAYLGM